MVAVVNAAVQIMYTFVIVNITDNFVNLMYCGQWNKHHPTNPIIWVQTVEVPLEEKSAT